MHKMERRSSKRAASSRASQKIESLLSPRMDPKLWGNLPPDILFKIYNKLLIRDFYNLRVVCKEWNNVACERRCSSDPVPKPYFVLIVSTGGLKHFYQNASSGTLAFNASSGRWVWRLHSPGNTFHQIGDLYEPFVVEGIFFKGTAVDRRHAEDWDCVLASRQDFRLGVPQNLLFGINKDHDFLDFKGALGQRRIPEAPRIEGNLLGMMVDTSTRPYTYKLIVGNCNAETLILDSQTSTWVPKPSRMVRCRAPCKSSSPKSCVQCDGHMYVWSDSDEIQVYSLEEDNWSTLNAPPRHESDEEFRGLGHWQRELYAVTKNEHGTLSVWKLIDRPTQKWSEYERIPSDMFSYLLQPGAMLPIVTAHCNEFLLMHVLTASTVKFTKKREKLGRCFVLFNISNKRWETVALPNGHLWKESP